MANLLGEPFAPYVNSQINARQSIYGKSQRTTEEISYLNSSNGWVKLASGVEVSEDRLKLLRGNNNLMATSVRSGKDLAINNVLFNGLSSYTEYVDEKIENEAIAAGQNKASARELATKFSQNKARAGIGGPNAAYGIDGTDFGYSPMPGIIDLNVKDLNRGSIKKATLNIKVSNRNQLEIIDVLYMRLGYTVLLEWGHSKYWDDSLSTPSLVNQPPSLIDTEFFKDTYTKSDYTKFLPKIQAHKELTRGNYDAMFGTVSNFSWTFEDDGSYNVKIEIISLGDIIESLNININTGQSAEEATLQRNKIGIQSFSKKSVQDEERFYRELYPTLEKDLQSFYDKNISALQQGNGDYFLLNSGAVSGTSKYGEDGIGRLLLSDTTNNNKYIEIWENQFRFVNTLGISHNTGYGNPVTANTTAIPSANLPTDPELANDVGQQQLNINVVMRNAQIYNNDVKNNESGRRILQKYYANILNNTFLDGNQVLVKLSKKSSLTQSLISVNKSGSFYTTSNVDSANREKYYVSFSGSIPNPTEINGYTGYDPNLLRGDIVLDTSEIQNNPGNKLLSNIPIGFMQLAPSNSNRYKNTVPNRNKKRGQQTYTRTAFTFTPTQKQILGELCTFASFKTFIFEEFKEKNRAGGSGDPRFKEQQPKEEEINENEGENQLQNFLQLANEKSVRGNFFKYFYNIRTLYKPSPAASEESKAASVDAGLFYFDTIPLNDLVEFQDLEKNPPIKCFEKIIGRVINPIVENKSLVDRWNSTVKFPAYRPGKGSTNNRYFPFNSKDQSLGNSTVDFFKLNITNIDQSFYIRFGTLLAYIRDISIPGIDSSANPPLINIDIETGDNVCYVIDNVISTNPRKVIVRNHIFYDGANTSTDIFSGISKFINGDSEKGYYGNLMNVYINFSRIEELISKSNKDGNVPLFDFIDKICQDINESLGYINNLEPVIDKDNNTIKIIDQTVIPNADQIFNSELNTSEQAVLEVFGYNGEKSNFVHSIGLTTQISKEYATMITIGATSKGAIAGTEATAFSKWNIGIEDRFKNNLTVPDSTSSTTQTSLDKLNSENKLVIQNYDDNIRRKYQMLGFTSNTLNNQEYLTFNPEFIKNTAKVCKDFYIYEQARSSLSEEKENKGIIESSIGFIPFNLKVSMDGLSGIKIYNRLKVNTNFLPSNYDKTLDFIVTGVNHQISDNKWTTSLETLATSKSVLGK